MPKEVEADAAGAPRAHVRKAADHLVGPGGERADAGAHRGGAVAYVDYRLAEITGDTARAVGTPPGMRVPAGSRVDWHYHECDVQLGIVTEGSVGMSYDGEHYTRATKDDLIVIPGHGPHEVVEASETYAGVEITFPGSFTTIPADAPEAGIDTPWAVLTWANSRRTDVGRGLEQFAHQLPERFRDRYKVERQRRYRADGFEPAAGLSHDEPYRIMFVTHGSRDVRTAKDTDRLGPNDILVVPGGASWDDLEASDDFEAIWITMTR